MIAQTTMYSSKTILSVDPSPWEWFVVGVAVALLTTLWLWLRKPRWRDRNR